MKSVTPFLMFEGTAEQAMNFYASIFPGCRIEEVRRYGPGMPGKEGSVMLARFAVGDQTLLCTDSPVRHGFTFTPSFSLFMECESDEELERLAAALAEGGRVLMPLDNYGFSKRFAWIDDRFGVSWQLNLA